MPLTMKFIETREELRSVYRQPSDKAVRKEMRRLDKHALNFLRHSPFVLVGTQGRDGRGDVTPRGDKPGFVHALDEFTLAIPDRPGNNRLDTFENILDNPGVGLLFLIPNMNETLRVNGEARLTADPEFCARFAVEGRPALAAMVVKVQSVYMHCAAAFLRSQLWSPPSWPDRSQMPTLGQILRDQLALSESGDDVDAGLAESYRKELW